MTTQPHETLSHAPLPLIDEPLSEQDVLFNAYFEGDLSESERAEFNARLTRDDAFRRDYEAFTELMGGLRQLPFTFAPDDFVDRVQSRIRTRSRGRFFAENYLGKVRAPYEVIAVIMIIIMTTSYMMMGLPNDRDLRKADVTLDTSAPEAPAP